MKPNTSFPPLGRVTDWETTSCVCWQDTFRCGDEVIYGWVPVRRLSFVSSRHLVLARIKTHQKSHQTPGNNLSDTLLMSGFQIFTADTAIKKLRFVQFFLSRKVLNYSQILARKTGVEKGMSLSTAALEDIIWQRCLMSSRDKFFLQRLGGCQA